MSKVQMQALVLKATQVFMFLAGVAFTSFNIFSFKVVKNGYYYNDASQIWLAVGITAIAASYVIKNWKNM